jgi:outer membrane protein insertion porin family
MSQEINRILVFGFLLVLLFSSGCNIEKKLPEGAVLYKGGAITYDSPINKRERAELDARLQPVFQPSSPGKFEMWAYYLGQRERQGFASRYLSKRYGKAPIFVSDLNTERFKSLIENRLENQGFFYYQVALEWQQAKNRKQILAAHIRTTEPYRIEQYLLDSAAVPKELRVALQQSLRNTSIKKGVLYDLEVLKAERERIDRLLKNRGYYNLSADFLMFKADTNHYSTRGVDLYLSIKPQIPADALNPHRITKVVVRPATNISDSALIDRDTLTYGDIQFLGWNRFNPEFFAPYIYIRPGLTYSEFQQNRTLNRLGQMGTFRFATVRYKRLVDTVYAPTDTLPLLAEVILSPLSKRNIGFEVQGVSKSNNFIGPAMLLTYKNRNLFKGGEQLNLSLKTSFETQIVGGKQTGLNSFELGTAGELIFPRITPVSFGIISRARYSVPLTKVNLSYSWLNRVQFYSLTSLLMSYGYQWQSTNLFTHEWHPVSVNLVNPFNLTPAFEEILIQNPFLARSFQQQFILGSTYSLQFSNLSQEKKRNNYFALFNSDLSGLMVTAAEALFNPDEGYTLFGLPFAQYARFDIDLRQYTKIKTQSRLITRAFVGRSFPIASTMSLPYVKQYFAGGPNSVRGFSIRSLGPGTYRPEVVNASSFFDQSGDIRLEANIEFRHPISGMFKGAVFMDAGNIWLVNDNPALPGGQFTSDWFQELAVGAGYGLRIDLNFFVVRFDLATPLRKPFLPAQERWVIQDFNPLKKAWRSENLVLYFAIGYPF